MFVTVGLTAVLMAAPSWVLAEQLLDRGGDHGSLPKCKHVPGDHHWPSDDDWAAFNSTVGGRLIKSEPIAQSCYPGPDEDLDECASVAAMWSDQDFQTSDPIGRPYPFNITCAPVDYAAGAEPTTCSLGSLPVYAVNATESAHVRDTLHFAQRRNVRLAVSGTGHDLLGRSDGYGALELWLHHFKHGIVFQDIYVSENRCNESGWAGSAIKIDGNYQWRDVYEVAKANKVIAVGGGSISPGAIGGWASGGGHGPATRNYGLGADQILEAEVMLADGSVVVANHCENADLFRAMRGGGPGYGVALSNTVKVYPNVDTVTAHHFEMAPLQPTDENADLLDAVATLLTELPDLNDAGFAGYAYWFRNFPTVFVGNATSGYTHGFWAIGQAQSDVEAAWAKARRALALYEDKLFINESWAAYDDYWAFFEAESGLYDPTGDTSLVTSRLVDRAAVSDGDAVRAAVEVLSGAPEAVDPNVVLLVSGGQVFADEADASSGLHPAWRRSHFALVSGTAVSRTATREERRAADENVTYVKGGAAKKLAPDTGGYMNEGDRNDPDFKESFYGGLYEGHLRVKHKYDPLGVFYCPTCVGSDEFIELPDGPLCRA